MAGFKNFGAETLQASEVNEYFMRQVVARVADAPALAAIPSPEPGMMAYREDTGITYKHDGTAWRVALEDTGWVPVTSFSSGYGPSSSAPVEVRRLNGTVSVRGTVEGTINSTSLVSAFTLPADFAPGGNTRPFPIVTRTASQTGRMLVSSTGVLSYAVGGGSATGFHVDALFWLVG